MSRKGDCWDNAVARASSRPSSARRLEGIDDFKSRAGAALSIGDYIDENYNIQRRSSAINYNSPVEFELIHSVQRATATQQETVHQIGSAPHHDLQRNLGHHSGGVHGAGEDSKADRNPQRLRLPPWSKPAQDASMNPRCSLAPFPGVPSRFPVSSASTLLASITKRPDSARHLIRIRWPRRRLARISNDFTSVRGRGLEPPLLSEPEPKTWGSCLEDGDLK